MSHYMLRLRLLSSLHLSAAVRVLISAATGAMALVLVNLMADHGLQYVLAATVLTGIIQLVLGVTRRCEFDAFHPKLCHARICECTWHYDLHHPASLLKRNRCDDVCIRDCHIGFGVCSATLFHSNPCTAYRDCRHDELSH